MGGVIFPHPRALDADGWEKAEAIIEAALAPRPPVVKWQLRLFLRLVNLMTLPSTGCTFETLPLERRASVLEGLERSRLKALRRGLWGVRTLLFMGYYTQDKIRERIGYHATPEGWAALPREHLP
ncbi:MAG: hypothetical protein ACWGSQ_14770 [Longimicrobiales bacterium]